MILYGASGHARVIRDIIESTGGSVSRLVDDNPQLSELDGLPVVHELPGGEPLIISIGSNAVRRKIAEANPQAVFGTAVAASAVVSPRASVGEGTVVMQGAIVQSGAQVGRHCIVNTGASVDHDCRIGDYVHISPHATLCGNVSVGEGTWVGAGTVVIQGIRIGRNCVIGAGSVVSHDVPDGWLAVGNRCKLIKQINKDQ